jgi:hypothetical protein
MESRLNKNVGGLIAAAPRLQKVKRHSRLLQNKNSPAAAAWRAVYVPFCITA